MDLLSQIDSKLFLAINHLPHTPLLNTIARGFSGIGEWGAIWILVVIFLFYREEIRDHLFFIPFVFAGVLSALSEYILKWIIGRPRPYAEMGAILLDKPGNYSFPSTHATIAFAYAYICSYVEKKLKPWVYVLAISISLSRMYLGVHYAFDILGGVLIGTVIGHVSIYVQKYWYNRRHETQRQTTSYRRVRSGTGKNNQKKSSHHHT